MKEVYTDREISECLDDLVDQGILGKIGVGPDAFYWELDGFSDSPPMESLAYQ